MAFCDIDAVAYVNATIRGFWYQNGMPLDVPQGAYTHHRTLLMSAHACKNKQSHGWKTPLWPSETWSLLSFAFSCAVRALLGRDGMYIYGKVAEPIRAWQWLIVVLAGRKKNCYQSVKICQTFLQSCLPLIYCPVCSQVLMPLTSTWQERLEQVEELPPDWITMFW